MSGLKQRLARLLARVEKQSPAVGFWMAPMLERRPNDLEGAEDAELEAIRQQAIDSGWRPESGKPYVIVVNLPDREPVEGELPE